jgi:hypothetical protein
LLRQRFAWSGRPQASKDSLENSARNDCKYQGNSTSEVMSNRRLLLASVLLPIGLDGLRHSTAQRTRKTSEMSVKFRTPLPTSRFYTPYSQTMPPSECAKNTLTKRLPHVLPIICTTQTHCNHLTHALHPIPHRKMKRTGTLCQLSNTGQW